MSELIVRKSGAWSDLRQSMISNSSLGIVGLSEGLADCVNLGNGQSHVTPKMMATTVQAIVGAVYLDGGDSGVAEAKVVLRHLGLTAGGRDEVGKHIEPQHCDAKGAASMLLKH